jgi:L-lysine exporter family protein LysE/ArgO
MTLFTPSFLAGLALSGSLIIAIGAQNVHVLRQGIRREHVALGVLTCALIDASLMAVGVFGVAGLARLQPAALAWVTWLGAAFLIGYGLTAAWRAYRPSAMQVAAGQAVPRRALLALSQTLAVSLLNPHVYLDTVFLVGLVGSQYLLEDRLLFWGGASSMSLLWFVAIGFGARWLAPVFARPLAWRLLDGLLALTMFYLAFNLLQSLRT